VRYVSKRKKRVKNKKTKEQIMEQQLTGRAGLAKRPGVSYGLWELRNAVDRYLIERDIGHYCQVTVSHEGGWFELEGSIDSQWTRAVLFSLVPTQSGKRFIIDKLRIVTDPLVEATLS
jgi:hypothetical protein